MKKKYLIIGGIVIVLVVIIFLIINKETYYIIVKKVDDYSPDRILEIYNSKNEKIDVKRIEYLDGTILCSGYNTTVHFGDVEEELVIVLENNSKVKAKILEEEVKK